MKDPEIESFQLNHQVNHHQRRFKLLQKPGSHPPLLPVVQGQWGLFQMAHELYIYQTATATTTEEEEAEEGEEEAAAEEEAERPYQRSKTRDLMGRQKTVVPPRVAKMTSVGISSERNPSRWRYAEMSSKALRSH